MTSGRVLKEEWPDYDSEERKKIASLIRRRNYLKFFENSGKAAEREHAALTWFLEWLYDENKTYDRANHLVLVETYGYLCGMRGANGYQLQERSAMKWAVEEIEAILLEGE